VCGAGAEREHAEEKPVLLHDVLFEKLETN
jgi:hypothetical protein